MNGRRSAALAALMLVAVCGGAMANRFFAAAQTTGGPARNERPKATGVQKWEYCSLSRAAYPSSTRGGLYWISYFSDEGVRVVEFEEQATERSGPAKALAKLGADGWEMVGQGAFEIRQGALNAIYFKRPKN